MRIVNRGGFSPNRMANLAAEVPHQENLKEMMAWAFANQKHFTSKVVTDVIVQDEFTHDVIVPWHDVVLVYDTT